MKMFMNVIPRKDRKREATLQMYNHVYTQLERQISKSVIEKLEIETERALYDISSHILFNIHYTIQRLTDKHRLPELSKDVSDYFIYIIAELAKNLSINLSKRRYYTDVCSDIKDYIILSQAMNTVFKQKFGIESLFLDIGKLEKYQPKTFSKQSHLLGVK